MVAYVSEFVVKRRKWMDQQTFKGGVVPRPIHSGRHVDADGGIRGPPDEGAAGRPRIVYRLRPSGLPAHARLFRRLCRVREPATGSIRLFRTPGNRHRHYRQRDLHLRQKLPEAQYAHLACGCLCPGLLAWGKPFLRHSGCGPCGNAAFEGDTGDAAGKGPEKTHFRRPRCQSSRNSRTRTCLSLPRPSQPFSAWPFS